MEIRLAYKSGTVETLYPVSVRYNKKTEELTIIHDDSYQYREYILLDDIDCFVLVDGVYEDIKLMQSETHIVVIEGGE